MASLVLNGNTSGSVTISSPAVSGTTTLTLPTTSGTVLTSASSQVTGPAFSAYLSAGTQSVTANTFTKIQMSSELFDTNSNFDSTTNYRFTPTTAGYYQINLSLFCDYTGAPISNGVSAIYKNGSIIHRTNMTSVFYGNLNCNAVISMNGTTDYLEFYGLVAGGSGQQFLGVNSGSNYTYVTGALVRSA